MLNQVRRKLKKFVLEGSTAHWVPHYLTVATGSTHGSLQVKKFLSKNPIIIIPYIIWNIATIVKITQKYMGSLLNRDNQ